MEDAGSWARWKKREGQLGYEEIYVRIDHKGDPVPPLATRPAEVQCCTLDRIPFCMRKSHLAEKYEATT